MPERTCICCRKKGEKNEFFRIAEQDGRYIYDENMKIQSRGFYICKDIECVKRISKNRKYNVELEELTKLLKKLEKKGKSLTLPVRKFLDFSAPAGQKDKKAPRLYGGRRG